MADAKAPAAVAVDTLPDAQRVYVFDGPSKVLYKDSSDTKGTRPGEEVTLAGPVVKHLIQHGSRFRTKEGAQIKTQRQIDEIASLNETQAPPVPPPSDPPVNP